MSGEIGTRGSWWGLSRDAKVRVALLEQLQAPRVGESRARIVAGSPELLAEEGGGKQIDCCC